MRASFVLVLALLALSASAATIKWTGIVGNGQWATQNNWYPAQLPGPSDDVTIDQGNVTVAGISVNINSLTMGTQVANVANLIIDQPFFVTGTINCEENGNIILKSGAAQLQAGSTQVAGGLYVRSGQLGGPVVIGKRGLASFATTGSYAISGSSFQSSGPVYLMGTMQLSQGSTFTINGQATAAGNFGIYNSDGSAVSFDASNGKLTYTGGGTFTINAPVNLGNNFDYQGGNMTIMTTLNVSTNLNTPVGSFISIVGGNTTVSFSNLMGNGTLNMQGYAIGFDSVSINHIILLSGTATFGSAASANRLSLHGGTAVFNGGATVQQLNLMVGEIKGTVSANKGYLASQGFNLDGQLSFSGSFATSGASLVAFTAKGKITFHTTSQVNVGGSLVFTGVQGTLGVVNNGAFSAMHATSIQNMPFAGSGSVHASSAFKLNTCSLTQTAVSLGSNGDFRGLNSNITIGTISAPSGSSVTATIGAYTFSCGNACTNVNTNGQPTSNFKFSA